MSGPCAAKGGFPYPHRSQAQIYAQLNAEIADLDAVSRTRALSNRESNRLEYLLRRVA